MDPDSDQGGPKKHTGNTEADNVFSEKFDIYVQLKRKNRNCSMERFRNTILFERISTKLNRTSSSTTHKTPFLYCLGLVLEIQS